VSLNEKKKNNTELLSIQRLNLEYIPLKNTVIKPNRKSNNDIIIESYSFDFISKNSEKNNKFDKAALSLEKGFNKSIQKEMIYSPKLTEESDDKLRVKMVNDDLKIYSYNFNFIRFKIPLKLYINSPISFETYPNKKLYFSMDSQTLLIGVIILYKKE